MPPMNCWTPLQLPCVIPRQPHPQPNRDNLSRQALSVAIWNRKLRRTTIHTDDNLWENPTSGNIKTFHSWKMDVHLSRKLTLIG